MGLWEDGPMTLGEINDGFATDQLTHSVQAATMAEAAADVCRAERFAPPVRQVVATPRY